MWILLPGQSLEDPGFAFEMIDSISCNFLKCHVIPASVLLNNVLLPDLPSMHADDSNSSCLGTRKRRTTNSLS